MTALDLVVGLVIAVGLVGILVPMLPGSLLIAGAVLVWALERQETGGWVVLAIVLGLIAIGTLVKYLVPGRRLQRSGVPNQSLLAGALLGVVGFFVVPVIGLPLGFVLGIYLAEWHRQSRDLAWPATVAALKAVGLGMLIELGFSTTAAFVWLIGAVVTG